MENVNLSTYCPLPWTHMYVGPDSKIAPCCIGKDIGFYQEGSKLEDAWNSSHMKDLRLSMLTGKKHKLCETCYKNEQSNLPSSRQGFFEDPNMKFVLEKIVPTTKEDGSLEKFEMSYIDMRFNNLCNFKCRTCNERFSSQIASEKKQNKLLWTTKDQNTNVLKSNDNLIEQFKEHYTSIRRIYFAGGEPMIQREHWDILEDLVNLGLSKNINLLYSTNSSNTTYKNKSLADYWPHFKSVEVLASLDAEGKRAEYWRDGTVWEETVNNLQFYKKYATQVKVYSVINWVTIYSWIDLVKFTIEENLNKNNELHIWNLTGPLPYNLQILPEFKKEEIKYALENFQDWLKNIPKTESIDNHINNIKIFMYLKNPNKLHKNLFWENRMYDKIRNKNFFDYFPEHENLREYINGPAERPF